MKTRIVPLATIAVLSALLIAPASAAVNATPTWQGWAFHGYDSFFGQTIYGFTTGTPATLTLSVSNTFADYLNVTGLKVVFDWNGNYSNPSYSTSSPYRINGDTVLPVTVQFTVPSTTMASNLMVHDYSWTLNYTRSSTPNNHQQQFGFGDQFAVLSSDQATSLTTLQQIPSSFFCTSFRTVEGSTWCQQSQQQLTLANNLYSAGDFSDAKNNYQNALTDWNNAVSADKSTGGNLELSTTVQGWGFLLLGIGAVVAGLGGLFYAMKRPKMAAMTTH